MRNVYLDILLTKDYRYCIFATLKNIQLNINMHNGIKLSSVVGDSVHLQGDQHNMVVLCMSRKIMFALLSNHSNVNCMSVVR